MENVVKIPVDEVKLFTDTVYEFQKNGLAFSSVVHDGDFVITITGY